MSQAKTFLELFHHSTYTLAYFSEKGMRSFPCAASKLEQGIEFLKKKNKDSEIYFMVNEGNGAWNDKKTACHSTQNVIGLSAIFLDAELADGSDPLPNIQSFCQRYFVQPSLVVQTSKNRYHCYWLLDKEPLTKECIVQWKQIQALLHSKLSSDRTMTDIPQILRVPGFHNLKKDFEVKLAEYPYQATYFPLSKLYDHLSKNFPDIKDFKAFEPLKAITEDYEVPEGERHEEMLRRVRKLYSIPSLSDEEVRCFLYGFTQNHVSNPSTFLPGGSRFKETERILSSAKSYAEQERLEEASKVITKHNESKNKSPFELEPDFFYQAPGLVGELTRYIVDTSDYPIPAHAFAAAVSLTGFTKARYVQGYKQLPPLNYFMCLAPSAGGKTSIQHVVKEILAKLQIEKYLEDGIASAQGLITFLSESNGLGIIMYDELKELFQVMQHKNAASYEIKIASELTKLYTAYRSTYTPPTTKTHKGKKVILRKPLFSFLGYGHFTLVESLFTKENVIEGLLPRFIILNVNNRTKAIPSHRSLPSHILDELRHDTLLSCIAMEEKIETPQETIELESTPTICHISHSPESQAIFNVFDHNADRLYNESVAQRNGLEALFSRGSEQVMRLSLAMTEGTKIDAKTMEFTTQLIDHQTQEFHSKFHSVVNETAVSKEINTLFDIIAEMCSSTSDYTILKRDLQRKVQHRYKNSQAFHQQLQELIEQEKITMADKTLASGQKQKCIRLDDVT